MNAHAMQRNATYATLPRRGVQLYTSGMQLYTSGMQLYTMVCAHWGGKIAADKRHAARAVGIHP
jgi:hypothetical protein